MPVVRSISRPIRGIARQMSTFSKRAFWAVDTYICSLLVGSLSLRHGLITEIVLAMLINSNASQYAASFKTH